MSKVDEIVCPHCGQEKTWRPNNPFRPFCSERCKLIDLGQWAAAEHRLPGEAATPGEEEKNE